MKADIGVIGLAVMGQNLVLNLIDHGYKVCVYNRSEEKVDETVQRAEGSPGLIPAKSIKELVDQLQSPRIVLLLIKSGPPVDTVIGQLLPLLSKADIIIDGGNSNFEDTKRRFQGLSDEGIYFVGMGISGGEYGARYGPSVMPGGSHQAWISIQTIFQDIAAKHNGYPCCQWIGPDGAGHFVKTVHNGIEYGYMQLISEIYVLMREGMGYSLNKIASVFSDWMEGPLDSYLLEITQDILTKVDPLTGKPLLDNILDTAGQKGTGKWTVSSALDLGQSLNVISSAVFQRFLSSIKKERGIASEHFKVQKSKVSTQVAIEDFEKGLLASKLITYTQGFALLRKAGEFYSWDFNLSQIAMIWRAGCIIRSQILENIAQIYSDDPSLPNMMLHPSFSQQINDSVVSLRQISKFAIDTKISCPAITAALAYFDGYTSKKLPANLIQAQRDYFGAHGYERVDDDSGTLHHTKWS